MQNLTLFILYMVISDENISIIKLMQYLRKTLIVFFLGLIFLSHSSAFSVLANNSPDRNHSSLSVANQAPADGHSTISATVTLQDSSGNALSGDSVTFIDSSNSSAVFSPTSATLDSSGKATFTITSTIAQTDNISINDTSANVTLNNLGQVTFTANVTPTPVGACPDPAPGGTPQFTSEVPDGSTKIILTWTDAPNPVSHYLLSYGTASGNYIYGNPNVGGQGTTSYTVGYLTPGTKYYFAIKAVNGCNPGSFSNEVSATAGVANTPTPAPTSSISPTPLPTLTQAVSNKDSFYFNDTPTPILDVNQKPTMAPPTTKSSSDGPPILQIIEYSVFVILALGIFGGFLYWAYLKDSKNKSIPPKEITPENNIPPVQLSD